MEPIFSSESYALIEKLANKFAYGTKSIDYDRYLNVGLDGLIKAINTYDKERNGVDFKTYAITCIRNAMCTEKKMIKRFGDQEDENIILDELETIFSVEKPNDEMADDVKAIIYNINNGNERNTEMVLMNIGLIDNVEPMSYKEIAVKFSVTTERVRQICANTFKAIKADKNISNRVYSYVG